MLHLGDYAGWISHEGIVACTVNSKSFEDFQDTLRHEGVHLAQICQRLRHRLSQLATSPSTSYAVSQGLRLSSVGSLPVPSLMQDVMEAEAWFVASLDNPKLVDT